MNRIKQDMAEVIEYFEWAIGLVVLLPNDQRAEFVTGITEVGTAFLTAIKKIQFPAILFGGDPFKVARLNARAFKEKWNGGI
jgi:hypothetical protein